jgi:hypothetical protein
VESSQTLADLARLDFQLHGWRTSAISHLIHNQMRERISGLPPAGLQWFLAGKNGLNSTAALAPFGPISCWDLMARMGRAAG